MILKTASDPKNCASNLRFTVSARAAWGHILSVLSEGGKKSVLLPGYIGFTEREGSGVFDPVLASGSDHAFYKLNRDLSIDLADFKEKLARKPDVVLVIHYFGFCRSDLAFIRQLCDEAGATLVEDCAHAFSLESSQSLIGSVGDFSFYSLHKHLPLTSGGVLKINAPGFASLAIPEAMKADREVLEQYAVSDFAAIKDIRRRNYAAYASMLGGRPDDIEIMFELSAQDIPQTFPVRILQGKREKLYFYLMDRQMPTTALYYRMIDQIDRKEHPMSFQLAGDILNLPVHQDTSLEDVAALCAAITGFFAAE
jgi:dTDP-4-amino-4,6-dideoxygalactose transaminase